MSILSEPYFHNEEAAYEFVESKLWPNGATCPKCGEHQRVSKMQGKSTRIGAYKCYSCRKPFTVKVGTIFEASHIKMHLWLQAIFLIASSKKGISSNQLRRTLGVTLKTAWFMSHRIREAQLMSDKAGIYIKLGKEFAAHHSVDHGAGEYVRKGNREIHTNTIENYFSVFKRGMKGTDQHCGHQHLNRYLAEFDFR